MSDDTNKAAAALLAKTARDVLHSCNRTYQSSRTARELAQCATPALVEVMRHNAALLHALVLNYAERLAAGMPPVAKPAEVEDWSINLFEPKPGK